MTHFWQFPGDSAVYLFVRAVIPKTSNLSVKEDAEENRQLKK